MARYMLGSGLLSRADWTPVLSAIVTLNAFLRGASMCTCDWLTIVIASKWVIGGLVPDAIGRYVL